MKNRLKTDQLGHRKRIKEKYRKNGLSGWLEYEILEFILTYAIPRRDTKTLAKKMLAECNTLSGVLDADESKLMGIDGVSEHTVLFLKLIKDCAIQYSRQGLSQKDLIQSPDVVHEYLQTSLKGSKEEVFVVLFLNLRNQLLAEETIQTGTVNRVAVYPRKIVERALHHNASAVIIAHNHPSGSLYPSEKDRIVTRAIRQALKTVEVTLLDHILIGGNRYFSFKENGID